MDLCFPIVQGALLDLDHGHALFLALREACPDLERIPGLGIHPVRGLRAEAPGDLLLHPRSQVRLRIPASHTAWLGGLGGASLEVQGRAIRLGRPEIRSLHASPALWCRAVTIHFHELDAGAARLELARRFARDFPWGAARALRPRFIRFQGRRLLAFEMAVRRLPPWASLRLQESGFGGRRALGCGVFVPFEPRLA